MVSASALDDLASRGGQVEIIAGVDFQLTDLAALKRFERPPSEARVYLHPDPAARSVFHPKVYLAESGDRSAAIVGSSNLTAGGLGSNVEANLLIRGVPSEPLIQGIRSFHTRLWNSGFTFRVTDQFRSNYQALQKRRFDVELNLRSEADFGKAQRDLRTALVEAIASNRTPGERRYWLLITSPANYIRNIQGRIWGDELKGRIGRVRPGDLIYFYITSPLKQLGAMGVVTREPYEDHTPHWPDERIYPFRFGFSLMIQPTSPIPFRPLVSSLDLFGRVDTSRWGQALQASMRELTPHDSDVLRQALSQADSGWAVA